MNHLLIDENVPKRVRDWLKNRGLQVTNVSETSLKMSKDFAIAEYAAKNNMTILTLDMDFAKIYHTFKKGALSVIVIKADPNNASTILETLVSAYQKIDFQESQKRLLIIAKKRVRIIS